MNDAAEMRGYDGTAGRWLVYLVEVDSADRLTFRFSDDMARTWKGTRGPVTFQWQPLSGGVEIQFKKKAWEPGGIPCRLCPPAVSLEHPNRLFRIVPHAARGSACPVCCRRARGPISRRGRNLR
ncbi:MAG: hypothetical protein HUU20_17305 [Pirellulales bacterium]|nr:hypothetical protein [Pirellulales bacterium]